MRVDFDRAVPRHGVAVAIATAALLLRLLHLDVQPLWFDEAMTTHIAAEPAGLADVHNTPPLYYWLLRAWTDVFGLGAAALRSLSAVAGALFVWAAFHAGRCAFGNRAALPAASFALLSPIHVYYSQEARAYSLLLFELMVATWMLLRLRQRVGPGSWVAFVVAGAAALYTHFLAAIPLMIGAVTVTCVAPATARRRLAVALGGSAAAIVLLLLPWFAYWWQRTPFESRDMDWLALLWDHLSGTGAFTSSLEVLLLGGQQEHSPIFLKQFTTMAFPAVARAAGLIATAALVMLLVPVVRRGGRDLRASVMLSAVLFVGPLFTLWAVSFVHPVWAPGRYDLVAFPALVLLLGGAIGEALAAPGDAARWAARGATAVLALVLAAKDWCYFRAPPAADPSPAVAQLLETRVQPDETVVLCGPTGVPVLAKLYQDGFVWSGHTCRSARTNVEFGCRLLPESLEEAPGSLTRYVRARDAGSLPADLQHVLAEARAPGIWIVLGEDLRAESTATARALLGVLRDAGYELLDGSPGLGVAHGRRK